MIAGATRGAGGAALARHLTSRKDGQRVHVLGARHLVAADLSGQIRELVAAARHGRTDRPVHHVHIDPPPGSDAAAVMKSFITHYEREFGLREVPRCGVRHIKNGRVHCHIVYSLVRPDGRVVSLAHEYARREKVSRIVEFELGLPFVKGKHNRAVAQALREEGRGDVADAMEAAGLLGGSRPVANQTPRERAQADRTDVPVAEVRGAAFAAWQASDSATAFEAALSDHGLRLAAGDRGAVVIDRSGAAHSLARVLSAAARAQGERIAAAAVRQRLTDLGLKSAEEVMRIAGTSVPESELRVQQIAAGDPRVRNIEKRQPGENVMKFGFRSRRKQDYKIALLAEIVPGFDATRWADDLHRIDREGSRPRIQTRDGGWIEIDRRDGTVRVWGKSGRAAILAQALAEAEGWHVDHLRATGGIAAPEQGGTSQMPDLISWWRERGYDAVSAEDGVWIDAGSARLQDVGDQVRLHGPLTPEAARAMILKAAEAWEGHAELVGTWSQRDQDMLWLEAQRSGVCLDRCVPSAAARAAWEAECGAAHTREETLGLVRSFAVPARALRDAASGDASALSRLDPDTKIFVRDFLDDEERAELAKAEIADIMPELNRFRQLGAKERARIKREQDIAPPAPPAGASPGDIAPVPKMGV